MAGADEIKNSAVVNPSPKENFDMHAGGISKQDPRVPRKAPVAVSADIRNDEVRKAYTTRTVTGGAWVVSQPPQVSDRGGFFRVAEQSYEVSPKVKRSVDDESDITGLHSIASSSAVSRKDVLAVVDQMKSLAAKKKEINTVQAKHFFSTYAEVNESLELGILMLRSLLEVCEVSKQNAALLMEAGALNIILKSFRDDIRSPDIVTTCCLLFGSLSSSMNHDMKCEVLVEILQGAEYHQNTFETQHACLRALYDISHEKEIAIFAVDRGSLSSIIRAMTLFHTRDELVYVACDCISSYAGHPENEETLKATNAIVHVLEAMEHHERNVEVLRAGTRSLAEFIRHESYLAFVMEQDCLEFVANAAKQFPGANELSSNLCIFMARLAQVPSNRSLLVSRGHHKTMLNILLENPYSAGSQCDGIQCLVLLALDKTVIKQLVKDVAIKVVKTANRLHIANERVVQLCCEFFGNISVEPSIAVTSHLEELHNFAFQNFEKFPMNSVIVLNSLKSLRSVCVLTNELEYLFRDKLLERVQKVLDKHTKDAYIMNEGVRLFTVCCAIEETAEVCLDENCLPYVKDALRLHLDMKEVAISGLDHLLKLCEYSETPLVLYQYGFYVYAERATNLHENSASICGRFMLLLRDFATATGNRIALVENGALEAAVRVISKFERDERILYYSMEAIGLLVYSPTTLAPILRKIGMEQILLKFRAMYEGNVVLSKQIDMALGRIDPRKYAKSKLYS